MWNTLITTGTRNGGRPAGAGLGRAIARSKAKPKYIICDKGVQFWNPGFKRWCKRKNIRPRFGAVGQHGSIAVIERFIRSMKYEYLKQAIEDDRFFRR